MKKYFIIGTLLSLGFSSAFSQGLVNANSLGSGVYVTVQDTTGVLNGGAPVNIGKPSTNAGFVGTGPGQVTFSLYAALNGTPLAALESPANLIATAVNTTSQLASLQGSVIFGVAPLTLPTHPGFDGSQPLEFVIFGETSNDHYAGWSAEATDITPAGGTGNVPDLFGTQPGEIDSFNLTAVPDQSSTAFLAGLAVLGLWLFRRSDRLKIAMQQ